MHLSAHAAIIPDRSDDVTEDPASFKGHAFAA